MIDRRIKFRHIQCFIEIDRHKSMKKASERLFLTQPAISKTLKELEEILGATLLIRNRAGVSLTKQGEVFLHFAQMSIASIQQGLEGVELIGRKGKTRISVGALPSVAARLMPTVVHELNALTSETTLQISDGPHRYLVDQLRQGSLDLVIGRLGPSETMQGLSFTQLYNEHVDFVVRSGHPILDSPSLSLIGNWQVIYPAKGSAIRPLVDRYLSENGVGDLSNRLETVSMAFGQVFTKKSDAIWIISAGVVANEIAEGRLVRLPFDTSITKGPVGLMTRPNSEQSPEEQIFRIALQNAISILGL